MSRTAFRIAVLSDQHIGTDVDEDSWVLAKRAFKAADRGRVDHVVLAGDLFNPATAMKRGRAQVERYLRKGGVHESTPTFGVLEIPIREDALSWQEEQI